MIVGCFTTDEGVHLVLLAHGVTGRSRGEIKRLVGFWIDIEKSCERAVQGAKQLGCLGDKVNGPDQGSGPFLQLVGFLAKTIDTFMFGPS